MTSEQLSMQGIVDKVRAVRGSKEQVLYLEATVRVTFDDIKGRYGDSVTTDLIVPIPIDSGVNPGHAVMVDMVFVDPFGQRFQPVLEVGNPADVLDEDA